MNTGRSSYALHTCEPFAIPVTWDIWRGCDDGYAAPACVLWFTHDRVHDRVYVIQELYERGLTPQALAHSVLALDKQIPIYFGRDDIENNDEPLSGVIDSAAFADTGGFGGRANHMNSLGCNWSPCEKGAGSRIAGIGQIHSALALQGDGRPGLIVFRGCKNLIRTLPAQVFDPRHPEDLDTDAEDHCVDALRYGLGHKRRFFQNVRVRYHV